MAQVRLQKFLAEAGVASRRASEKLITSGRVSVNGQVVDRLGSQIDPGEDEVACDGKPVKPRRKLYVALHKPRGYVCTRAGKGKAIGELLPQEWRHLYSVGRLDRDSEGLIFLTNDGEFSQCLTHPRYGTRKTYHVVVPGKVPNEVLRRMERGITHEGERLGAQSARFLANNQTQSLVEVILAEGKNREIRRLFEAQGCTVARLTRVQIGKIKLGDLPPGRWRVLTGVEVKTLYEVTNRADATAGIDRKG